MPQPVKNLMFVVEVNGHKESSWSDLPNANRHAKLIIRWAEAKRERLGVLIRAVPVEQL